MWQKRDSPFSATASAPTRALGGAASLDELADAEAVHARERRRVDAEVRAGGLEHLAGRGPDHAVGGALRRALGGARAGGDRESSGDADAEDAALHGIP